jgi:hypothetical protein
LLDRMLRLAGWERPWDRTDVRDLPADHLARTMPDGEVGSR